MATSPRTAQARAGEIALHPSQLRPGVHVRLPLSWVSHQFLFSSFVIESEDQVRQIEALRLPELYCDVARCTVPPSPVRRDPPPAAAADASEAARLAALTAQQLAAKQERIRVMTGIREHLETTHKHYVGASRSVGKAFEGFDADPKESMLAMDRVSGESTALLLTDVDSAIVMIAEKGQSDGFAAHALSVMTLSLLLGKQARLPEEALRTLGVGALLHDIGKLAISASILRNPERNKHEEAAFMTHCRIGWESVRATGAPSRALLEAILHHHERFDGGGYPDRLAGEKIHIAARVIAIADRFDTLANPIDARLALSPSEALSTMWVREKKAFDPLLLQLFVRAMGIYPPGSIVQLSDGRIGVVVISAMTGKPLCPQVMIHEPEVPRHQAIIVDLALDETVRIERSLRLADRSADELDYLLPRRRMSWFHGSAPA